MNKYNNGICDTSVTKENKHILLMLTKTLYEFISNVDVFTIWYALEIYIMSIEWCERIFIPPCIRLFDNVNKKRFS